MRRALCVIVVSLQRLAAALIGDDINQFIGHHDHFTDGFALGKALYIFVAQSHLFNGFFVGIYGHLEFGAHLAIDLSHHGLG